MEAFVRYLLDVLLGRRERQIQSRRASRWVIVYGPDGVERFREPAIGG